MRMWFKRIAFVLLSLAMVLVLGLWIGGRWVGPELSFGFYGVKGEVHGNMGGVVIALGRYVQIGTAWAPRGYQLTTRRQSITQPLWKDIYPPFYFYSYSGERNPMWDVAFFVPYWSLVAAFSLAIGGLGFWLARKRPHRKRGFAVLQT